MWKKRFLKLLHKIKPYHLLLAAIVLIAVFFRFYNTPARYGFDNDPTRDILLVQYAATHKLIPLTGALSGIAPFTFGPWYYYHLILVYLLFPFQYSPWVFIGLSSVLAVLIMYKAGKELEGPYLGLILAFLMAISPSETGQTQGLSNPDLVPLYSALIVWLFVKLIQKPSRLWILFWSIALGIGINIHYQIVCLMILPVIFFIYHRKEFLKNGAVFVLGFLITFIPFIIFNLKANWHSVTGIVYYISKGRGGTYIPNSWTIYVKQFWLHYFSYIFGLVSIEMIALLIFTIFMFAVAFKTKKLKIVYIFLFIAFIFDFVFLRYFLSQRDYYYYLFLHPFIFIFVGFAIYFLTKFKYGILPAIIILGFIAFSMMPADFIRLNSRADFLNVRKQAKLLSSANSGQQISFYVCSDHGKSVAQGLMFFLESTHQVSENSSGQKIGVGDFECKSNYAGNSNVDGYSEKLSMGEDLVDLTSLSDPQLNAKGWKLVSPQTVYHDTVDWWEAPK